jgi:hypothetical protein
MSSTALAQKIVLRFIPSSFPVIDETALPWRSPLDFLMCATQQECHTAKVHLRGQVIVFFQGFT